ncbi:hypothetical protein D3C87_1953510 [compost metagenome]
MHLLQGTNPAWVHVLDIVEQGLQVAGDDCQWGAQFMGDVGDEILAHLFEQVNARNVAYQHQVFIISVASDVQLYA